MKKNMQLLLLCTSFWVNSLFCQNTVPVYLYFASHNETNDSVYHNLVYDDATDYVTMRSYIQQVCDTIIAYNAKYEMMLESNFILACLKNENAHTNPSDIIQWADDNPNIEVQPHNHFRPFGVGANPYNYADLCYLLDSCGLSSTSEVMGGFIWRNFTSPTVNEDWTQWQLPKAGNTYPLYSWQPTLLWGGGSPNHVDDFDAYGIWKPKAANPTDFGTHDASKTLVNFGNGCGEDFILWDTTNAQLLAYRIMNFADSVQAHFSNTPNAFFNMKVMMNFRHFPSANYAQKLGLVLRTIQPYINSGKIQYKGIMETYQAWQALHPNPADYFDTKCENTVIISNATPAILTEIGDGWADDLALLQLYPNPASSEITLQKINNGKDLNYSIYDLQGKNVYKGILTETSTVISLQELEKGVYFLRTEGVNSQHYKIILQ